MVGRYQVGQAYLVAQGRVFVVRYAYGQAANWQELEDAARQAIGTYRYAPYGTIAAFGAWLECALAMLADSLDEQSPSNG